MIVFQLVSLDENRIDYEIVVNEDYKRHDRVFQPICFKCICHAVSTCHKVVTKTTRNWKKKKIEKKIVKFCWRFKFGETRW